MYDVLPRCPAAPLPRCPNQVTRVLDSNHAVPIVREFASDPVPFPHGPMSNHSGSKKTLSTEVIALRKQVSDLKEAAHERRRVEDALRVAETLYHNTLEDAPVAILRLSPAGKVLFANSACIRLLGYDSRQDFQTIGDLRGVFADDAEIQRINELMSRGEAKEIVVRCRLRNGEVEAVRLFAGTRSLEEGVTLIHSGGLVESYPG